MSSQRSAAHAITLFLVFLAPVCFAQQTRFAVIGDFGSASQPEADVAALVKSWDPEFILTVGDNNYENGEAATIDANIGQYYHEFISPYAGTYGAGDTVNRFFPCLGNHDWVAAGAAPYLDYFTLPGIERYYEFVRGPVHFFSLDVDPHEPDGIDSNSVQAQWLKAQLASATEKWKIVYMHHSPYSSCSRHGSYPILQWPYERWGASAVFSGHDHTYERILPGGIPYFVDGLGGKSIYTFATPVAGSQFRYNGDYGAMRVEADQDSIVFTFVARTGDVVDRYPVYDTDTASVTFGSGWELLSIPLRSAKRPVATLFPDALSRAFRLSHGQYEQVDSLEAGTGYWLKLPVGRTAQFAGDTIAVESVKVVSGWNIISGITRPVSATSVIPGGGIFIASRFVGYAEGYYVADTLLPGKAYWVKVIGDGFLYLFAPSAPEPSPPR